MHRIICLFGDRIFRLAAFSLQKRKSGKRNSPSHSARTSASLLRATRYAPLVILLSSLGTTSVFAETSATTWDSVDLVTLDPDAPPPNLLNAEELELLTTLNTGQNITLLGEPSPDEHTILGTIGDLLYSLLDDSEEEIGFWDLSEGEFTAIEWPDGFTMQYSAWVGTDRLRVILENSETLEYYLGEINRQDNSVWLQTQALPISGDIVAISPNGRWVAILADIESETETSAQQTAQAQNGVSTEKTTESSLVEKSGRRNSVSTVKLPINPMSSGVQVQESAVEVTAESARLLAFDLESGTSREIIDIPETSYLDGISFSPDGSRLAFVQNYLVDEDESDPVYSLTTLQVQDALGRLPPSENPYHINSRLTLFDITDSDGGQLSLNADALTEPNLQFANTTPIWSPSGNRLIVTLNVPASLVGREWPTYFMPQAITHLVLDTKLNILDEIDDEPVGFPVYPTYSTTSKQWLDDDEILFLAIDQADYALYRYTLESASITELFRTGSAWDLTPLSGQNAVLMVMSNASEAPEIWRLDLETEEAQQLTALNSASTKAADVVAHPVDFTLADGESFSGYWFAPKAMTWPPQQQPVVFWQHGGPGLPMTNTWQMRVEIPTSLLPSFGISVLMVPLQHRPGNSPAVWNSFADGKGFGSVDIDSMAEIAGQLVDRGWASSDGLGITGCSYGGYMTSQSIVRHPSLWTAANTQCSLIDLITVFQSSVSESLVPYLMGETPWQAWQHYIDASPGFHGNLVQADTLIFHGTEDFLPITAIENFFYDISAAGLAETRMIKLLGESHGYFETESQFYAAQEQILWFRHHLQ